MSQRSTSLIITDGDSARRLVCIFERFIQLGKHVKIAINISIAGAFG